MFLLAHAKHFVEEGVFPFPFLKEGILWNIRLLTPITFAALGKLKHSLVFIWDIQIKSALNQEEWQKRNCKYGQTQKKLCLNLELHKRDLSLNQRWK